MKESLLYFGIAVFMVSLAAMIISALWLIGSQTPVMYLKIDPTGNCVASGNIWLAFEGRCVGAPTTPREEP